MDDISLRRGKEKRFELHIRTHEKVAAAVTDLVSRSIAANTLPKLAELPESMDVLKQRRAALVELYAAAERSYTPVMVSGGLFAMQGRYGGHEHLGPLETRTMESQKEFIDRFPRLYVALHDYVRCFLIWMDLLYEIEMETGPSLHIWDTDITNYREIWIRTHRLDILKCISRADREQERLLHQMILYANETRDALAVFSDNYKQYELAVLMAPYVAADTEMDGAAQLRAYLAYCKEHDV